jgi:hypothetical protein
MELIISGTRDDEYFARDHRDGGAQGFSKSDDNPRRALSGRRVGTRTASARRQSTRWQGDFWFETNRRGDVRGHAIVAYEASVQVATRDFLRGERRDSNPRPPGPQPEQYGAFECWSGTLSAFECF